MTGNRDTRTTWAAISRAYQRPPTLLTPCPRCHHTAEHDMPSWGPCADAGCLSCQLAAPEDCA